MTTPRMTQAAFTQHYSPRRMATKTYNGLLLLLVHGMTWHAAATRAGVHQSTLARVLHRHPPPTPTPTPPKD